MLTRIRREDTGVTMVEMLVASVVMAAVGLAVVQSVATGVRAMTLSQVRAEALADITGGVEQLGREVRAAYPMTTALSTELRAEVCRGTQRQRWRYRVAAGNLLVQGETWSGSAWSTTLPERVLVERVTTAAPFTYLNANGATTTNAAQVARVRVVLQRSVSRGGPVSADTTLTVRNHRSQSPSQGAC